MHDSTEDPRLSRVQHILVDNLGIGPTKPNLSAKLVEDLGADSLDGVELVMAFEEEYHIDIPDEHVEKEGSTWGCQVHTVQDILDYLNRRLGPAKPDKHGVLALTEDQFIDRYGPENNEEGHPYRQREWDGKRDEKAIKKAIDEKRCWTAVDGDDGEFCICWGNRTINRMYNILTARPIEDENWDIQVEDSFAEAKLSATDEKFRCVVPCRDAAGGPDLFFCEIICQRSQYDEGLHYAAAKQMAEENAYEAIGVVIDENDPGFQYISFAWEELTSESRFRLPSPKVVVS